MLEIGLTIGLWGPALWYSRQRWATPWVRSLGQGLGPAQMAMLLLLMATHSRASRTGAADTLSNPFTPETMFRGGFALAALLVIAPLVFRNFRLATIVLRRWWGIGFFGIYVIVAWVSFGYSATPLVTAGKMLEMGIFLLVLVYVMMSENALAEVRRMLEIVLFLEMVLMIGAIIGFFVWPAEFAITSNRTGFVFSAALEPPFASSNALSARGAVITAFAVASYLAKPDKRDRPLWAFVAAVGTIAMILASGRQGVAIWVASLLVLLWVYKRQVFLIFVAPLLAVFGMLFGGALVDVLSRDQVAGSVATLTGRTTFWSAGMDAFSQRPFTGYGFGTSRKVALEPIGADQFTHLHNGYLEAMVGVGLMGFIPLIASTMRVLWWSLKALLQRGSTRFAILAIPLIMQNFLGLGFGGWLNFNLVIYGLLVALADLELTEPKSRVEAADLAERAWPVNAVPSR